MQYEELRLFTKYAGIAAKRRKGCSPLFGSTATENSPDIQVSGLLSDPERTYGVYPV